MTMCEAFEKWWNQYSFNPAEKERMHVSFDSGWQAAIEHIKTQGVEAWLTHNGTVTKGTYHTEAYVPLYRIPEDV